MISNKKATVKADNYGQLLAAVNNMELISFKEDGGYQGEYLAVLKDTETNRLFYHIDNYGSCSGCDWLEAEKDWDTGEVDYKKALEYCQQSKAKYIAPVDQPLQFRKKDEYNGWELVSSTKPNP